MATEIDLSATLLPPKSQAEVKALCAALEERLGGRLVGVSLYGSGAREDFRPHRSDVNLLVVTQVLDLPAMRSLVEPVARARRAGIAPSFVTEGELAASTDIFPVKYLSMKESHRRLLGRDVLASLAIGREHVRLRCEQELASLVLELRELFFEAEGRELDRAVAQTVGGLLDVLRVALTLTGEGLVTRKEVPDAAGRRIGVDPGVLRKAMALREGEKWLAAEDAIALFEAYLAVVSGAARFVDGLDQGQG